MKQLDNEICYFEEQNRKHAQAQSQLQKALEYELCRSKELSINEADAKVRLRAREQQCQQVEHDRNKQSAQNKHLQDIAEEMNAEIEALNQHMNVLTNQNFELSQELQNFLQTDEIVKTKLNRRSAVEEIKSKVDQAIQKSIREVESRRSPVRKNDDFLNTREKVNFDQGSDKRRYGKPEESDSKHSSYQQRRVWEQ